MTCCVRNKFIWPFLLQVCNLKRVDNGIRVKKTDFPRGKSEAAGRVCSAVVPCKGVRIRAGGSGPRGRYQALTGAGGLLTPHVVAIAPSWGD